jgi:lipopolysaccharide/colanic/teichoic acid biosynthesis glycosyltransferase
MRGTAHAVRERGFDVVVASAAVVVLALPLVLIALATFVSDPRAPVLYRQERCGRGGRPFRLWKFRTMLRDADTMREALRHLSLVPWPDFRVVDDPRVTRLGGVLRRTSLDELPQLLNVLRGDMSLVGPRPTSFQAATYDLWQTERLEFRPGLTGPWQVHGRRTMDFVQRCRLEIRFFRHATFRQEIRLLVATGGAVLRRSGVA